MLQNHVSYIPKAILKMIFLAIILLLEIDLPTVVPTLKSTTLSVVRSKQEDGKVYEKDIQSSLRATYGLRWYKKAGAMIYRSILPWRQSPYEKKNNKRKKPTLGNNEAITTTAMSRPASPNHLSANQLRIYLVSLIIFCFFSYLASSCSGKLTPEMSHRDSACVNRVIP